MSNIKKVSCECIVLGGGIIGLSIASKLAAQGIEVILLEKEKLILQHASSHNSEVIHSGIYYPPETLKSRLCIEGNKMLYEFCEKHKVDFIKSGKLIFIDKPEDKVYLEKLSSNAAENGIKGVEFLDKETISNIEPNLIADSALLIKTTGTIDSHTYAMCHEAILQKMGGHIIVNSPLLRGEQAGNRWELKIGGDPDYFINTDLVINCTGSSSIDTSRKLGIPQPKDLILVKGHYYKYNGANPFRHLIYPIPDKDGLGIHTSTDISGVLRFGPDAEVVKEADYTFDDSIKRRQIFIHSIKKYFKGFKENNLSEDYTGIRFRTDLEHNLSDFIIEFEEDHGYEGLINLIGIESPGLTASLAIAKYVANKI